MIRITSKENAKFKTVRALMRSKKERQRTSCFVVEGVRALNALVDGSALSNYHLKEVWVSDKAPSGICADYCVAHDFMEQLSDCRTSQGVLGVVEYTAAPLDINPEKGNYILLDQLKDPGNMGTMIRSAVAFGFDGVLLYGDCVEIFNPKTVRATMGALPFSKVWKISDDVFQTLETFGYDLVSTALVGGENVHQMSFGSKTVFVFGNEANGISMDVFRKSTRVASIPMFGNVESLNAAVAGSICMSVLMQAGLSPDEPVPSRHVSI